MTDDWYDDSDWIEHNLETVDLSWNISDLNVDNSHNLQVDMDLQIDDSCFYSDESYFDLDSNINDLRFHTWTWKLMTCMMTLNFVDTSDLYWNISYLDLNVDDSDL